MYASMYGSRKVLSLVDLAAGCVSHNNLHNNLLKNYELPQMCLDAIESHGWISMPFYRSYLGRRGTDTLMLHIDHGCKHRTCQYWGETSGGGIDTPGRRPHHDLPFTQCQTVCRSASITPVFLPQWVSKRVRGRNYNEQGDRVRMPAALM